MLFCYFFDPRDPLNSKNVSLHGVPEARRINCCVMNSSVCSHCLHFSKQVLCQRYRRPSDENFVVFQSTMGAKKY